MVPFPREQLKEASAAEPEQIASPGVRHSFRAFRHRDYALFWSGAITSNTGGWLSNLTVPFVIYGITHSALWVGLVSVFQFVPNIVLGPVGGVLADRHDRRRVLLVTQTGMALSALMLWVAWRTGVREPLIIMALVGVSGTFQGINMPSWQSFVNDLVPREDLDSAVALNSLQFNAARSMGPAIAGLLLAAVGPSWALLLNAFSFSAVLLALALIRPDERRRALMVVHASVATQFVDALRYVRRQPGIQVGLLVAVLIGLLGNPIFQFTIVFAHSVFHIGPVELGLLNASIGLGSLMAAPVVSGWRHRLSLATLAKWGLATQAVAMVCFGLAPNALFAAVALAVFGGCLLVAISATNTAVQLIVANPMRGRVLGVRIMLYTGTFPIGGLVQGALSDRIGPRPTVISAGLVLLAAATWLILWRRSALVRRLDDPHDEGPVAVTT